MEEKFLDGRIYRRRGRGGKGAVVLVHGLSGSSSAWVEYERCLEEGYDVLTFDLRGHGKSLKYHKYKDYEIGKFAEDLYWLLGKEKIRKFTLISHSFGNLVALEFLKKHSRMVDRIIFLSAGYNPSKRIAAKLIIPFLWIFSRFDFFPIRKLGWHLDYSNYIMTGDWNIRRMLADVRNTTLRVYLYSTLQSYFVDSYDFLGKIKQPTLIVHGEKDTIFPIGQAKEMCAKIKDCKMITLPEADHILVLNHYPEVSKIILQFLKQK